MAMQNKTFLYISIGLGIALVAVAGFFILRTPATTTEVAPVGFGIGDDRTVVIPADTPEENAPVSSSPSRQKVFKIVDGPVTSATLIQTTQPTTTLARYILQENGHVLELALDTPGAIPRAVSNTTIPGSVRAEWVEGGRGALLQYFDDAVTKTLYLGFPQASTTATTTEPVRVRFFPDNITSIAPSPSGTQVGYLLTTANGTDAYTAKADGSGSTQLFSLPLGGILLSWPAEGTLLAQMKSAANTPGIVFSAQASSGSVVPLLFASGLTATANPTFSHIIYQTISAGQAPRTYIRTTATGAEVGLSFDPIPEKCIWGTATTTMYCATPVQYVPPGYLGLWHQGAASLADAIISYNILTDKSDIIAIPGGDDGGVESDIVQMSVSADARYIVFVKKGDRSLWGVRLDIAGQ